MIFKLNTIKCSYLSNIPEKINKTECYHDINFENLIQITEFIETILSWIQLTKTQNGALNVGYSTI